MLDPRRPAERVYGKRLKANPHMTTSTASSTAGPSASTCFSPWGPAQTRSKCRRLRSTRTTCASAGYIASNDGPCAPAVAQLAAITVRRRSQRSSSPQLPADTRVARVPPPPDGPRAAGLAATSDTPRDYRIVAPGGRRWSSGSTRSRRRRTVRRSERFRRQRRASPPGSSGTRRSQSPHRRSCTSADRSSDALSGRRPSQARARAGSLSRVRRGNLRRHSRQRPAGHVVST